jgi:pyruvate decarboxylase
MFRSISATQIHIDDEGNAAALIDRALSMCYTVSRPVYIALPTDYVFKHVSSDSLSTPLSLEFTVDPNTETENYVLKNILQKIYSSERPIILADACSIRHRVC